VGEAIRAGLVGSATQHFESDGFQEGKLSRPGWSLLKADSNAAA
jgi:hypothetical protein